MCTVEESHTGKKWPSSDSRFWMVVQHWSTDDLSKETQQSPQPHPGNFWIYYICTTHHSLICIQQNWANIFIHILLDELFSNMWLIRNAEVIFFMFMCNNQCDHSCAFYKRYNSSGILKEEGNYFSLAKQNVVTL